MTAATVTGLIVMAVVLGSWAIWLHDRRETRRDAEAAAWWAQHMEPGLSNTPKHLFKPEDELTTRPHLPDDYRKWHK